MITKYIVCWVRYVDEEDYYKPFIEDSSEENLRKAKAFYDQLIEEEVWSANLTEIIESTDY